MGNSLYRRQKEENKTLEIWVYNCGVVFIYLFIFRNSFKFKREKNGSATHIKIHKSTPPPGRYKCKIQCIIYIIFPNSNPYPKQIISERKSDQYRVFSVLFSLFVFLFVLQWELTVSFNLCKMGLNGKRFEYKHKLCNINCKWDAVKEKVAAAHCFSVFPLKSYV